MLSRSSSLYTTEEAVALHESVPPDRWCVTRADLKQLRREVWQAIQKGEICPPDDGSDNFDSSDQLFGPSIYTVNKQHIMPVTDLVGKVSWALMIHPDGLECHLFISHAWQEGVFEFLSKVLHSWPRTARNAWCCMLANPQNLDIGSLLQAPSSSPFALALRASSCVLVIPNRHCSIYTRLWCVYEAYCAHEEGKTIFIARASNGPQLRRSLLLTAALGVLGMVFGACTNQWHLPVGNTVPLCLAFASVFASVSLNDYQLRMVLNRSGTVMCGCMVFHWHTIQNRHIVEGVASSVQRVAWLIGAVLFLCLEVDRVNGRARQQEEVQLRSGFEGTIAHATCSVPEDAVRIHSEIGDKMDAVDYAVHVLMTAGMSSQTLREVARAGIDISGAGYAEIAAPIFLFLTCFLTLTRLGYEILDLGTAWYFWLLQASSVFARIALLIVLCRSAREERCFILKMTTKLVLLYLVVICPVVVVWELRADDMPLSPLGRGAWFSLSGMICTLCLVFACLGMRRVAALPWIGPRLLLFFLTPGSQVCRCKRAAREKDSNDSNSSTSE